MNRRTILPIAIIVLAPAAPAAAAGYEPVPGVSPPPPVTSQPPEPPTIVTPRPTPAATPPKPDEPDEPAACPAGTGSRTGTEAATGKRAAATVPARQQAAASPVSTTELGLLVGAGALLLGTGGLLRWATRGGRGV